MNRFLHVNKRGESLGRSVILRLESTILCPERGEKQVRITLVLYHDFVGFQIINFLTSYLIATRILYLGINGCFLEIQLLLKRSNSGPASVVQ